MAAAFSWFLALRYLLSRWVNLLGTGGVAVAIWALIVVVAVFSGFISGIRDNTRNASPQLLISDLPEESSFEAIDAILQQHPDVVATAPRLEHYAMYYRMGLSTSQGANIAQGAPMTPTSFDYVSLIGVDPAREPDVTSIRDWLQDAAGSRGPEVEDNRRFLTVSRERFDRARRLIRTPGAGTPLLRTPPGILFGIERADQVFAGQPISIVTADYDPDAPEEERLRKVRRIFAVAGSFESRDRVLDATSAIIHIEELRSMLGHDVSDPFFSIDLVSDVAVRLRVGVDLDASAASLRKLLADNDQPGSVLTWEQQHSLFLGAVDQERGMMKFILFAVILVSSFLIYATMHMMVTQKIKDIGILSSMGASRPGVRDVFLLCGGAIAVFGCAIGATAGIATAVYLNEIDNFFRGPVSDGVNWVLAWFDGGRVSLELFPRTMFDLDEIPVVIETAWVVQVTVGAFLLTLLAAWLPARRAARFEPVRALGYE